MKSDNVRVHIRIRPISTKEIDEGKREIKNPILRTPPTKIAENGHFGTKIVADPGGNFEKFFFLETAETLFCTRILCRAYPLRLSSSKMAFFEPRSPKMAKFGTKIVTKSEIFLKIFFYQIEA